MDDATPRVPRMEGLQDGAPVEKAIPPFEKLEVSSLASLSDLATDYVFFNHGVLFTYGGMNVDPAQEYAIEHKCEIRMVRMPKPVFKDVSNRKKEFAHWDHSLLAVDTNHWVGLSRVLVESGILDLAKRSFYKAYYRPVKIVDWFRVDQAHAPDDWPTIRVALFGLDGNTQFIKVVDPKPGKSDAAPPTPKIVLRPPNAAAVSFANALFSGHERPYDVIDPKRNGRHS